MKRTLFAFLLFGMPSALSASCGVVAIAATCGAVNTPAGQGTLNNGWSLIFDDEFNYPVGSSYTSLNPVWTVSSGNNLIGGSYCWAAHSVTFSNPGGHEIQFNDKKPCWAGTAQDGEGARISTGPVAGKGAFTCSATGQVIVNGTVVPGFCFNPQSTGSSEIYEEVLYDIPCDGVGHVLDHPVFWNVGGGAWASTNEFDIIHPDSDVSPSTHMFSIVWSGAFPNDVGTNASYNMSACGWHVFGAHWIGGTTPSIEFWADGTKNATISSNVTTSPQQALIELGWSGTNNFPTTTEGTVAGKAKYIHIFGLNVTMPAIEPEPNFGGPGDTASMTLGSQ